MIHGSFLRGRFFGLVAEAIPPYLPVLITTAGAIEPMGFARVCIVGAAPGTEALERRVLSIKARGLEAV